MAMLVDIVKHESRAEISDDPRDSESSANPTTRTLNVLTLQWYLLCMYTLVDHHIDTALQDGHF